MSLGTASVVFPMWLSCLRDQFKSGKQAPGEVRVVTGWGKHSEADVRAPIRRMMVAGLGAMESPFKADPNNRGTLVARGSALKQWLLTLPSNWHLCNWSTHVLGLRKWCGVLASIWRNLRCHSGAVSRLPKFESMLVQSGSSNFFLCKGCHKIQGYWILEI